MSRQARRKAARPKRQWKVPRVRIPWRLPTALAAVAATGYLVFELAALALDQPIRAIEVEGSFQRVSALDVEATLHQHIGRGFFSADLRAMRRRLEALDWVDSASIRRRWPDTLQVGVTEHLAAARWGESGLLNTRGELFLREARHLPAELPRLEGPDGAQTEVAARYLELREQLADLGLRPAGVRLDARGAWEVTLSNGVRVRLGRAEVDARLERFLTAAGSVLMNRMDEVDYVDMRYSNGFSVGWTEAALARRGAEGGTPNG